jgi:hypothetical protein
MSVLALPRLVFRGTTSWNPNTVNNSPATYREESATPQFNRPSVNASNYDTWLKTIDPASGEPPGSWNIYGDQGCSFVKATVTRIQLASGPAAGDPLLGQAVQMVGTPSSPSNTSPPCRMVDVDPYSPYTTQIFYQTIVVGDTNVGVSGPGSIRMFSRWPNLMRNIGAPEGVGHAGQMGVEWQATVAAHQLTWHGVDRSPALAALQSSIEQGGQGLVLRFASYGTVYFTQANWNGKPITTWEQLSKAYLGGFQGPNPAVSTALGRIGVWGPGELASAPTERVLRPGAGLTPPTGRANFRVAADIRSSPVTSNAATTQAASAVQLGTAFARVDPSRKVVTLDFLGTFPEQDISLAKADFGTFELQAVPSGSKPITIGQPLTYDQYAQTAYEAGGGIVDFPFRADQASLVTTGLLQLVQRGTPTIVALQETPLLAETDQRGVYVDQGQKQQITIQVYQRGATPPLQSVKILLATYNESLNQVDSGVSNLELLDAQGDPLPNPPVLTVGSNGSATFGVRPRRSGIGWVVFLPYFAGTTQPTPPDLSNRDIKQIPDSYAVVRALPFDNFLLATPPSLILWEFVYTTVLQTYNLVYPLMSLILNLGDKTTVDQNAPAIAARTSLEQFLTTNFMPITREMSAGKRFILQTYLSRQRPEGGSAP